MASRPTVLFVGSDPRVKEFADAIGAQGYVAVALETDPQALEYLRSAAVVPAGIVFIVPDYWESVGTFVDTLHKDEKWRTIPIIYFGDVIEADDQIFLKSQGVHTLTLGPVPPAEAVRYVLRVIGGSSDLEFDIAHPKGISR